MSALPEGWSETSLGEYIKVKHGFAFKGEFITEQPTNNVLVTPGNFLVGGGFKSDKFKYFSGDIPNEYVLNYRDIIVTMTDLSKKGDTLGYPALVPKSDERIYLHNQRIGLVELVSNEIDKDFLYWLLRTRVYQKTIVNSSTGSTVRHTSPSRMQEYSFSLPPLPEQKAIAGMLSSFDEKIELLREQKNTLETLAQTIFKEWFVNFNYPDATGEMVDSELGEIPKGWRVGSLLEVFNLIGGGTPKTSIDEYWNGGIPWYSVVDAPKGSETFVIETEKQISPLGLSKSSTKLLQKGTTIVSARGTVGKLALVGCETAMNQSCYGIQGKDYFGDYYVYFQLKEALNSLKSRVHGAVFDTITQSTFKNIMVALPDNEVVTKYEERVTPIMEKILNNVLQIQSLSKTRDTLLPKLMGGYLRVREAVL